jgi:hypothetical protein
MSKNQYNTDYPNSKSGDYQWTKVCTLSDLQKVLSIGSFVFLKLKGLEMTDIGYVNLIVSTVHTKLVISTQPPEIQTSEYEQITFAVKFSNPKDAISYNSNDLESSKFELYVANVNVSLEKMNDLDYFEDLSQSRDVFMQIDNNNNKKNDIENSNFNKIIQWIQQADR